MNCKTVGEALAEAAALADGHAASREISLVKTKIEEEQLWLRAHVEKQNALQKATGIHG